MKEPRDSEFSSQMNENHSYVVDWNPHLAVRSDTRTLVCTKENRFHGSRSNPE